jgi:hypothetical protein
MFTVDVLLLVRVTVCDCFAPTVTLPKASLVGSSISPSDSPVPASEMVDAAFVASLVTFASE